MIEENYLSLQGFSKDPTCLTRVVGKYKYLSVTSPGKVQKAEELNSETPSKISEKPRIDLRMHKLSMSLTEKAPGSVHTSPSIPELPALPYFCGGWSPLWTIHLTGAPWAFRVRILQSETPLRVGKVVNRAASAASPTPNSVNLLQGRWVVQCRGRSGGRQHTAIMSSLNCCRQSH